MKKALKAYSVQAAESGCIIFAQHNVVARREGANELNCDFEEIESCKRAPEFDQYAAIGKVPMQALLDAGWWWDCQNCERRVSDDGCDDDDNPGIDQAYVIHDETVYCCQACRDEALAEQIMRKRRIQAWTDCTNEKWHGVTVQHASEYRGDADVSFTFPGGSHQVHWKAGENVLHLPLIDHPAWAAFTGKPVEIIQKNVR